MLKRAARAAFHHLGGLRLVRWNRRGLRILMYHRFAARDREALARQCAHIRRYYTPADIPGICKLLKSGGEMPPKATVITVDDGHRDFLEYAWPVLKSYGLTATVYLISGFTDGELWPWFDQVQWMFTNTPATDLEIGIGTEKMRFDLSTKPLREAACDRVVNLMPDLEPDARADLMCELGCRLQVKPPARAPEAHAPLSWDDVRRLAAEGVDFGAHTVTHPILSQIASNQQMYFEVNHSKARIEQELGRPALSFCYPNGRAVDVSDAAVETVRRAGFEGAVLSGGGVNLHVSDSLRLRRIAADPQFEDLYFRQVVAGLGTGSG